MKVTSVLRTLSHLAFAFSRVLARPGSARFARRFDVSVALGCRFLAPLGSARVDSVCFSLRSVALGYVLSERILLSYYVLLYVIFPIELWATRFATICATLRATLAVGGLGRFGRVGRFGRFGRSGRFGCFGRLSAV